MVERLGQVAGEQHVGVRPKPAPPQIHHEKGQIVEHVPARDRVVELDGVEGRGLSVEQHDVAQVEIAVALPHEAGRAAAVQKGRLALELGQRRSGQRRRCRRSGGCRDQARQTPGHCRR